MAKMEAGLFLCLVAGVVLFQLLDGRINVRGLMDRKPKGGLDPARAQMLVLSLALAITTILQIDQMRASGEIALPSDTLLYVFGSSQALYLFRKRQQLKGD